MKKLLCLALLLLIGVNYSRAQIHPDDQKLNWKQRLKKANELLSKGSYYNAIDYYKSVLEEKPDAPDIMFSLAQAYYGARDYENAEPYFKRVYDSDNKRWRIAQYYYGLMLKMNGKYQEAYDQLKEFSRKYKASGREAQMLKKSASNEYKGCQLAMQLLADTANLELMHMPEGINALYTEFAPREVGDSMLIFGSLKVDSVIVIDRQNRVMPKARLYAVDKIGNQWGAPHLMPGPFNDTRDHVGNGAYSLDGKRFYFTHCTENKGQNVSCDIYVSELKDDGKWSNPKKLSINDPKANDTHPWVAPYYRGGEVLYFSSNREGGQGGMDLWYSVIKDNGKIYDDPRNLGRRINTPGDEITPFFDKEENVLYFSSNKRLRNSA